MIIFTSLTKIMAHKCVNESEVKSRAGKKRGVGVQIENLPLFCLANHNTFTHTVITMSKLVIVF